MAEPVADTPSSRPGLSRARVCANIGLALGLILALTEVTVAVRFESDAAQGPRYRVVVLGFVVFRYPEDGELYRMRPFPQVRAARQHLVAGSTLAGGVIGWLAGYVYGRLTRRSA